MRRKKLLGLGMAVALMVVACGGGPTVEAAGSPLGNPIAVHGDWTIEVYNPDGTLDERHEFSNALTPSGSRALSMIMTGEREIVRWGVQLWGPLSTGPCDGSSGTCSLEEPALTVETTAEGSIRLAGSMIATHDGSIDTARTHLILCTREGESCPIVFDVFTWTDIDEKAVLEGQMIEVEVIISFTTG